MIWPWSRIVPRRSTYELTASERCCTHLTRSTMRNTMSRSIDQHSLTMSTTTLQSQNSSLSPSRSHGRLQAHKASRTLIRQNSQSSVGPQEHADLPAPHSPATGPLGCLGPQEPAPPPEHGARSTEPASQPATARLRGSWLVGKADVTEACHFDSAPADRCVRCELWNKQINILKHTFQ